MSRDRSESVVNNMEVINDDTPLYYCDRNNKTENTTSVLMIWVLTALLVYAAIERIINQDFDVDATVMLYTAAISVLFNVIMGLILHFGKTPHSHFGMSHSHQHDSDKTYPVDPEVICRCRFANKDAKEK
ncbi:unnamed protein product [Gongylonema pulchrum]|uniref:DUF4328 domain-containing protein n=1 Tax=Gongylonema pulchrum TaxID=637853 RepID=A0A183E1I9_9BILA|nr:unnamed protein product [Gongylonema pulchrum]